MHDAITKGYHKVVQKLLERKLVDPNYVHEVCNRD